MKLQRTQDYRILEVRGGKPELVNQRCRVLIFDEVVEWPKNDRGFLVGLSAWILSGKWKMQQISLPEVKLRAAATRKCSCPAYPFPHAPGFGKCKFSKFEEIAPEGMELANLFTEDKT